MKTFGKNKNNFESKYRTRTGSWIEALPDCPDVGNLVVGTMQIIVNIIIIIPNNISLMYFIFLN